MRNREIQRRHRTPNHHQPARCRPPEPAEQGARAARPAAAGAAAATSTPPPRSHRTVAAATAPPHPTPSAAPPSAVAARAATSVRRRGSAPPPPAHPSLARAAPSGGGEEEWSGEGAREGGAARSSWSLAGFLGICWLALPLTRCLRRCTCPDLPHTTAIFLRQRSFSCLSLPVLVIPPIHQEIPTKKQRRQAILSASERIRRSLSPGNAPSREALQNHPRAAPKALSKIPAVALVWFTDTNLVLNSLARC
jgi:hypothetical protein